MKGIQSGVDLSDLIRKPALASVAVMALWFPFAETPQPAPTLKGNTIIVAPVPVPPQPDRRCSLPGEKEQCIRYCAGLNQPRRPEAGWNPDAPILLATYQPQAVMVSCDVRTIGNEMTLVCECADPGLRT